MKRFEINENDAGQRLDKFITKVTVGMPKSLLYKCIRQKRIKVNRGRAHEGDILSPGDVVEMYIPDEFFGEGKGMPDYSRTKIVPAIVYEDADILLCDKQPGILVHLGDEGDPNRAEAAERETLLYALTAVLANRGEYDPAAENSFAPALCNRIDRNTGGIVILAKNAKTLRAVNEAIREDRVTKRYLCAVHGRFREAATLRAWHRKNHRTNTVEVTEKALPGSKEIVTKVKPLAYDTGHDLTLCEVTLVTGRTHQIRAHLAHIGHPLLGEGKYAKNAADRKLGYDAQALYSCAVSFSFPPEDPLSRLNGRVFTVDPAGIRFLALFPDFDFRRHFRE
ncbi:MAG: RluA family pseudouridine synthase [Clostridia bacterium]|nr:RluA family pseudouridine synthase [Clostridia bacterium]